MSSVDGFPTKNQSQLAGGQYLGNPGSNDVLKGRESALADKRFFGSWTTDSIVRVSMFVIAAAGLAFSSYLGWAALTSSKVVGCSSGELFDCSHVLQSKWSTSFGIPVGVLAAGLYLTTLACLTVLSTVKANRVQMIAKGALIVCATSAAFAALWFIGLQLLVVERLCQYCLAAHTCGLLLAGLVIWKLNLGELRTTLLATVALVGFAALATGQIMSEEPDTFVIETHTPIESTDENDESGEDAGELFSAPGFEDDLSMNEQQMNGQINNRSIVDEENVSAVAEKKQLGNHGINNSVSGQFIVSMSQMLAGSQIMISAPATRIGNPTNEPTVQDDDDNIDKDEKERRIVSVNGGRLKLDAAQWALAGSADADLIFVEMFDYTCPHCRENHRSIKGAIDRLGGDKVAVLAMVTPLNARCNNTVQSTNSQHAEACELANISLALWRVDREKFAEFHDWLFEGNTPSAAAARAKAESLVDKEKLAKELGGTLVGKYVAKHVDFYKRLGSGTVPKLLFPGTTVTGKVGSVDSLVQIINQQSRLP